MPASPEGAPDEGSLPERLARAITLAGPISLAQFMGAANAHYYATRVSVGADGDFITAPEISQMFGELVGAWLADRWARAGGGEARYLELGPGRGTLAADALRVLAKAGCTPHAHFVETSPLLRARQAERFASAHWHATIDAVPPGPPLLVVANEFFDALPIRQLIRTQTGWRERLVACQDTLFLPVPGRELHDRVIPRQLRDAPVGAILETSPDAVEAMRALARLLLRDGGAALVIDYGYSGPAIGDTLQAVRGHARANPFDTPGEQDLTAHVDFATLAAAAQAEGAIAEPLVAQGEWLVAMGIDSRAAVLGRSSAAAAEAIAAARNRLVREDAMGTLFKVLALRAPGWPA